MGYREVILGTSGLVAYWRLGEASGTTAADESGNGRNGTYSGGYTLGQSGAIVSSTNTSVLFNGTSAKVTGPTDLIFPGTAAFSVECWLRLFSEPADNSGGRLVAHETTQFFRGWSLLYYKSGGVVSLIGVRGESSASQDIASAAMSAVAAFVHAAMTYDGSTIKLYLNGSEAGSVASTKSVPNDTGHAMTLGTSSHTGGNPLTETLNGWLDEVAIYSLALAAAEIRRHYSEGLASAGLKRPWAAA